MSRLILHCDMNNFYASVACLLDSSLRGRPVAVCGSAQERHGIVLAKNYQARAFGVQTGEAIWQARQKCPGLVIVPPHYEAYLLFSSLARHIYGRYTNLVEPYGLDECYLDLTGVQAAAGGAQQAADRIRKTVREELGLTISVGVSFNKVFAKLGSDMKKPDAVTVISEEGFREQVWALPASALLGVGRSTARVLAGCCIRTIGELAQADPEFLRRRLGKNGLTLWRFANGQDRAPVRQQDAILPIQSAGHGVTTVRDLERSEQVWPVMLSLTQELGSKLRLHRKRAGAVAVQVRDNALSVQQWQGPLALPTQSPMELARAAFALFEQRYRWVRPVRSVTVQAIRLVQEDAPRQLDLFTDEAKLARRERLEGCVAHIRERFGDGSIRNAVLCQDIGLPHGQTISVLPSTFLSGAPYGTIRA